MDLITVLQEAFPQLLEGLMNTVLMTLLSLSIAVFLGLFACLMGLSKNIILKSISKFYVWLIRGTPLMVQAFFVYFAIPQMIQAMGIDFRLTAPAAGVITLSLNAGAYISELFRGGIQAVDPGQMEAARSLGLTYGRAMAKVILPQALRISIPSLVNQFIITLKDTSIISVISFAEIVYEAKIYIGRTMQSFATWTIVAIMYLVIISLLSKLSRYIEKRLSYERT
ncbi:MAG: amino acid ABC transporter permease [Clostridiales bacterium]|nr:amino acid ABC transporter permease [Clostridiales bacterium]